MFGFEFEVQLAFKDAPFAGRRIYVCSYSDYVDNPTYFIANAYRDVVWCMEEFDNWEFFRKKTSFYCYSGDWALLRTPKRFKHVDSGIWTVEIRNYKPKITIEKALANLNCIAKRAAEQLYKYWKIPFAFIIPPKYYIKDFGYTFKHLNISINDGIYDKLLKEHKRYCDQKGNRMHLSLPYAFTDYSVESLLLFFQDKHEDSDFDFDEPFVIGIMTSSGWIKKNDFF